MTINLKKYTIRKTQESSKKKSYPHMFIIIDDNKINQDIYKKLGNNSIMNKKFTHGKQSLKLFVYLSHTPKVSLPIEDVYAG